MNKRTLTTYEIANYCQVTPRTAIQWVNEGKLKAFRTPGNHSRVAIEDFLDFLNKYKMPIPKELAAYRSDRKKRVLIVDDDKGMVNTLKLFFTNQKIYEVEVAFDGFEAGEKFASFKPHLVLLDIVMPGIDGYKVCSRIRSNPDNKQVKILFISGTIDGNAVELIKKAGADDYLVKPFELKALKDKVWNLLGLSRRVGGRK